MLSSRLFVQVELAGDALSSSLLPGTIVASPMRGGGGLNGGWRGALCCLGGHLSREDFHIDACVTPPPQALGLPDSRERGEEQEEDQGAARGAEDGAPRHESRVINCK